jgi:hypothetical protein
VIKGAASQLSVAVAVPLAAGVVGSPQFMVTLAGQVIIGGTISWTNIFWVADELRPQASVAVQVRTILKLLAHVPAMVTSLEVIDGTGLQLSVAVAVPVFAGS